MRVNVNYLVGDMDPFAELICAAVGGVVVFAANMSFDQIPLDSTLTVTVVGTDDLRDFPGREGYWYGVNFNLNLLSRTIGSRSVEVRSFIQASGKKRFYLTKIDGVEKELDLTEILDRLVDLVLEIKLAAAAPRVAESILD